MRSAGEVGGVCLINVIDSVIKVDRSTLLVQEKEDEIEYLYKEPLCIGGTTNRKVTN